MRRLITRFHFNYDVVIVGGPCFLRAELRGKTQSHGLLVARAVHGYMTGLGLAVAGDLPNRPVIVVPEKRNLI